MPVMSLITSVACTVPMMPGNTLAKARQWADHIGGPAYAIDDHTAITVVDGAGEVISDGRWEQLAASRTAV